GVAGVVAVPHRVAGVEEQVDALLDGEAAVGRGEAGQFVVVDEPAAEAHHYLTAADGGDGEQAGAVDGGVAGAGAGGEVAVGLVRHGWTPVPAVGKTLTFVGMDTKL